MLETGHCLRQKVRLLQELLLSQKFFHVFNCFVVVEDKNHTGGECIDKARLPLVSCELALLQVEDVEVTEHLEARVAGETLPQRNKVQLCFVFLLLF